MTIHLGSAYANNEQPSGCAIPAINIPASQLPENDAMAFIRNLKMGWNLGNTFDAFGNQITPASHMTCEWMWCGEKTKPELFQALKNAGFGVVRLPVSWHNHVDGQFNIYPEWLDRVQEVVDYALDNGLYVILNIHHDDMRGFYFPTRDEFETSKAYITAIWSQLSQRFAGYDERLLFESINEPRVTGSKYEWYLDLSKQECLDAVGCINLLNQAMVDTVRKAGGNNAARYILVPGHCASADGASPRNLILPHDSADNRIIVSVHAYIPYGFALESPDGATSTAEFNLESAASTGPIDQMFERLYQSYTSKGIPVLIGEFGARAKGDNLQDRIDFTAYYVAAARAKGITCLWWDNNAFSGKGENFGLLGRKTLTWIHPDIVLAMRQYSN